MQRYDLHKLWSKFGWPISVVSFKPSAFRTSDRQQEELERVGLLFVDLDGTCQDYRHLSQSEITLAKSQ